MRDEWRVSENYQPWVTMYQILPDFPYIDWMWEKIHTLIKLS